MRLIDADALINDRETFIVIGAGDNICIDIADINKAPTIEAKPVVHGEWVWDVETHGDPMYGVDEDFGYRCSECKVWADEYGVDGDIYEEPPTHILHFCPNCGADMRGET